MIIPFWFLGEITDYQNSTKLFFCSQEGRKSFFKKCDFRCGLDLFTCECGSKRW
jgi:hypothetical protein